MIKLHLIQIVGF